MEKVEPLNQWDYLINQIVNGKFWEYVAGIPIGAAVTTYGVVLIISVLLPKSNLIKDSIW